MSITRPLQVLLTATFACVASTGGASGYPPTVTIAAACTSQAWSTPYALRTTDSGFAYLGYPRAVRTARGLALFGAAAVFQILRDTVLFLAGGPPDALAGVMVREAGTVAPIALPPGTTSFRAPLALAGSRGTARVLWGNSTDTARARRDSAALWTSAFDGSTWTTPRRIPGSDRARWNPVVPGAAPRPDGMVVALLLRGDSTLIVAVPDSGAPERLSALQVGGAYTRVAGLGDSTLVLAYVGSHPGPGQSEHSSVFSRQSRDAGRTWSPFVRIHHSIAGSSAHWPQLLVSRDRTLYLVWAQEFRDDPDSVLAVQSADSGRSWRRLPGLSLTGDVQALAGAADGDGRIHVAIVATDSGQDSSILSVNTWRGPSWFVELRVRDVSEPISIAAVTDDTIYATWTTVHRIRDWQIPTTSAATLTLCHPSPSPGL